MSTTYTLPMGFVSTPTTPNVFTVPNNMLKASTLPQAKRSRGRPPVYPRDEFGNPIKVDADGNPTAEKPKYVKVKRAGGSQSSQTSEPTSEPQSKKRKAKDEAGSSQPPKKSTKKNTKNKTRKAAEKETEGVVALLQTDLSALKPFREHLEAPYASFHDAAVVSDPEELTALNAKWEEAKEAMERECGDQEGFSALRQKVQAAYDPQFAPLFTENNLTVMPLEPWPVYSVLDGSPRTTTSLVTGENVPVLPTGTWWNDELDNCLPVQDGPGMFESEGFRDVMLQFGLDWE